MRTLSVLACAAVTASALHAQNIVGTWQGTIVLGGNSYREAMIFSRSDDGWKAVCRSLDEASDSIIATTAALEGRTLKVVMPPHFGSPTGVRYEGTLAPDGRSVIGTWTDVDGQYALTIRRVSAKEVWTLPPPHTTRFIQVDTNVKLEVLDWGGSGRPMVLLSGLGDTGHVFDFFAPKFTAKFHVYAITRRGFGASSWPAFTRENYRADRLGDDVLAVIDSLGLSRPILVGHSIAGEELSSIGSRQPAKVAGLIYLEAGYGYAYYDPSRGDFQIDLDDLFGQLQQLRKASLTRADLLAILHSLRDSTLPRFEKDVEYRARRLDANQPPANAAPPDTTPSPGWAVAQGAEKYTSISVPILAIFALPTRQAPPWVDSVKVDFATSFEHGIPTAHVVRIPNASHYVFQSNETDVLREMNAFLATLPPS